MSEVDFESVLNTQLDDVEKPPLIPAGAWQGIIKSHKLDKSSKKQTPFVRYMISPQSPGEDVDADIVQEIGMDKIVKKEFRLDFYLTPDSMWILKRFLSEHVGLDIEGKTLDSVIGDPVNNPVGINIKHSATQDGSDMYAEIDGTFAAE